MNLSIESHKELLIERLGVENPTDEQLQAEFQLLVNEARLQNLQDRYDALVDKGIIQAKGISNPDLHFQTEILEAEAELAEQEMLAIEAHYEAFVKEMNSTSWIENRKKEYAKIDELLLEALAEQAEGRPEKMIEYLQLRQQIKQNNPKD